MERAVAAVRVVSCLPLLWASNVAHPEGDAACAKLANGAELLRLLAAVREDIAGSKGSGSPLDPVVALERGLEKVAQECEGGGGRSVAAELPADMLAMFSGFKRKADAAAIAKIQRRLDESVHKPLQKMFSNLQSLVGSCVFDAGAGVDVDVEARRLGKIIAEKRGTVLDNAFQRSLGGNYARFPLHAHVFAPLRSPDVDLPAIQAALAAIRDEFFRLSHTFLVDVVLHFSGGVGGGGDLAGRALRGVRGADGGPARAAVAAAVATFLKKGGRGAETLQADFDTCFGRVGSTTGPFGRTVLRRLFERACCESLADHLLTPAQRCLTALRSGGSRPSSGGGSGEDVKKVLKDLVHQRLGTVYGGVRQALLDGLEAEMLKRAERLYRRLAFQRVHKHGPLVAVHLAQGCIDSAAEGAAPVVGGSCGRTAAEEVRQVAARAAELAQAAGWDGEAGPASVDRLVTVLRERRVAEWRALGLDAE